jgi:hypothetical protein
MVRTHRPTEGYCPDAGHFIPEGVPNRIEQDWRLFHQGGRGQNETALAHVGLIGRGVKR